MAKNYAGTVIGMLLAVLELAEVGLLLDNRIYYYNQQLLERFRSFFQAIRQPGDSYKIEIYF
ncbi:MAG: hypothetical protein NTV89_18310 [Proteobacteria bacterium]|nr:hypothetical protein [Pseudomonadota bacterium]